MALANKQLDTDELQFLLDSLLAVKAEKEEGSPSVA